MKIDQQDHFDIIKMTPRGTPGLLFSYSPVNDSSGYWNNTVYLAVMLQAS